MLWPGPREGDEEARRLEKQSVPFLFETLVVHRGGVLRQVKILESEFMFL